MKPEAFRSSTSAPRNRMVSGRLAFVVPTACRISMKRPSMSRTPGCELANSVTGSRTPAAASRFSVRNTSVPSPPRTTTACRRVRLRNRS